MSGWRTAHAFALEAAKREILDCHDADKLQKLCLNLLMQIEAQKDMIGELLLKS